jgi:hypothetical protein
MKKSLSPVLDLPRDPGGRDHHDAGEQHERGADAVDADLELDAVLAQEADVLHPGEGEDALELVAAEGVGEEDVEGEHEHREAGDAGEPITIDARARARSNSSADVPRGTRTSASRT